MASQWPPKKNTAFTLCFTLYKNDGTIIANPGTYTKKVSTDLAGVADIAAAITEEDTTYGQLSVVLSAAEMNGDVIWVYIVDNTAGCVPFTGTLYTVANTQDEIGTDLAAVHTHVGTIDGHITADYTATEKTAIDLLDDASGGLADIHTDLGTALSYIDTEVATIKTQTDKLTFTVANKLDVNVYTWNGTAVHAPDTAGIPVVAIHDQATVLIDAILDEVVTSGHATVGSLGKLIADNLNAPVATVDTVLDALVADIGSNGAGLTAIPWNAAWDTEVQSECTDALNAYDPPTNTEMEARTILSAGYATATNLATVHDNVVLVLADTNELQAEWADGGRLDLILDAASSAGDPWAAANGIAVYNAVVTNATGADIAADIIALKAETVLIVADTNELQLNQGNWVTAAGFATPTNVTDAVEAVEDYGDLYWKTAIGFSTHSAADVKTALEANGSKLDHVWEMTEDDSGIRRLTANALEQAPGLNAADLRSAVGLATANLDTQLADLPTVLEFEARTLAAADYVVVGDTIAAVTSVATTTNLTNLPAIPGDWITAAGVKADAVTKIQAGLATPTNITAGTITTVTNLTNAPGNGDFTATMKESITDAVDLSGVSTFDPATDTVARVALVDTTTTNSDMRGTNGAALAVTLATTDAKIDNILIDTGITIPTQIAGLNDLSAAEVNAEVVDVLGTDVLAELPAGTPVATPTIKQALMMLYMAMRNERIQTDTQVSIKNDAGEVIFSATLSDDGTTVTRTKLAGE
jgi:hypothetical protein